MANNRFKRGSGVFKCDICGHNTRDTGQGNTDLCQDCYDICGLDNSVNDGIQKLSEVTKERDTLLAHIAKKGGDVERVKKQNNFLFPTK